MADDDMVPGGKPGYAQQREGDADRNTPGQDSDDAPPDDVKDEWQQVHQEALLEYERDYAREQGNIDEAYEDLRFRRGRLSDQWDALALEARKGRPCHVVNKLPQFIRQVTGDMRKSKPAIKVVPTDSGADVETAEVRAGMIRYIENRSKAKHIYTTGADSQVTCGIGHWEVTTEYSHLGSFNQEIRIVGIEDSVAVVWDADAFLPSKSDADHCFVPTDMTRAKFKQKWPWATQSGFDVRLAGTGTTSAFDNWVSDDFIRVMKYWKKKPIQRWLALMPDGAIQDVTEAMSNLNGAQRNHAMREAKKNNIRMEQRDSYVVCRYMLTMAEVIEEEEWPGMHIPVVPVIGEEVRIGRDLYRHGIVRYARDLQRMENYYSSAETETIALQPKAPWLGTRKQFEQDYDKWETANTENHPFLQYTPDPHASGPPSRIAPPVASQGIAEAKTRVGEDMKAVIGLYDASLGAKSNEISGVAIARRDEQADTGTFVYHDNFALAIERTAEITNDLFPRIYDTQRQIQILGNDGQPQMKVINKPTMVDGVKKVQHDMTSGSYDVMMEQGPGYATKREQAQDGMTEFLKVFPPAVPLIGDIYAKNMDWPHAQEIGERLEEALPPAIKQKIQAEREQANNAGQPVPPTPEQLQQKQAEQQAQQEAEQAKQLQMAKIKAEADEAEAKARKAAAEADRAEIEAKIMKQRLAESHMESLRTIEAHDHEMADGQVSRRREGQRHAQSTAHAQDEHEVGMTERGLKARLGVHEHAGNAAEQEMAAEQGQEKHTAGMQAQQRQQAMAEEQHQQALQAEQAAPGSDPNADLDQNG